MQADLVTKPEEKKRKGPKPDPAQDHPPSANLPLFLQRKEQSQPATQPVEHEVGRTPFLWGQDTSVRPFIPYVSITVPDATLEEVALYLYGSIEAVNGLSSANGGISGRLTQGQTLHLSGAPLSDKASGEFNVAISQGTILRSKGVPTETAGGQVYRFTAAGRSFELTEGQYVAMLQGSISWIRLHAGFAKDKAEAVLETQRDFIKDTNSVVRGISNYMGDAEMPSEWLYLSVMTQADALIGYLNNVEVTPESRTVIASALIQLQSVTEKADEVEHAWHRYIDATIEGASSTVHKLEITRNVAFGVAAGLAGAVAAPALFAAAGGGLLGGTVAVAGGAGAGALTGGALQFTGAVGGEGLSMAVTPGRQSFDWGYVRKQTKEGVKSGALQGGLGALGALAAPGVSGLVGRGVTSVGGETFAASTAGRYTINALTGTALGAPLGGTGAAIENAGALAGGDISTGEYFSRIGSGTAWGGLMGGATSFIPIQGLTREGGIPWRGDVAPMPRWMFAGPWSPLQTRWEPPAGGPWVNAPRGSGGWNPPPGFNQLPLEQLPQLPSGLAWTRVTYRGQPQWEPMATYGPNRQPVELTWYDNPNTSTANHILRSGNITFVARQTFGGNYSGLPANTGAGGTPLPGAPRSTRADYGVPQPADFLNPATGEQFTRGHMVDFQNTTPRTQTIPDSNLDPANFAPEQSWWGGGRTSAGRTFGGRFQLTRRIGPGGQTVQYNMYGSGRITQNGTPIPDSFILIERNAAGMPTRAWQVPNNTNAALPPPATTAAQIDAVYALNLNDIPQPILDDLRLLYSTSAAAGTADTQRK